jgi:DHA2 family multidrug resistance protein-like MFS transporter
MGGAMSTLAEAATPQESRGATSTKYETAAIVSVLAAMVLVVLDAATVNVALPTLAKSLHVPSGRAVAVVTAYQLGLVIALLPTAALGESLGYRQVFKAGVLLFTAASIACSLSPSLTWLVAARFVQGLGGAAVMSLGVALMRQVVSPSKFGAVVGWNALAVALVTAAGPALGSIVLSIASWQWIFAATRPLAVVVLLASRALPNIAGNGRKVDLVSVILNTMAFAALVTACEFLPSRPAFSILLFAVAATGLVALVRRERSQEAPLIPLDLLQSVSFRISVIASVLCFAGQTAGLIALPFYFQHRFHLSAFMTGFLITPWPLTTAFMAPVAGRLADRVSGAFLCAVGGLLLAVGLMGVALWPASGPVALLPFVMLCGGGFGLFQVSNNRNMFLSAPKERSGAAGGMQGTARLTGQTIGAVMMTMLFSFLSASDVPRIAMTIGGVLTLTAGIVSVLRRPAKTARL